ncbi:hypothetical protein IIA79_06585, partial [bacterium]|nr:hypothetical protein [bacterium]
MNSLRSIAPVICTLLLLAGALGACGGDTDSGIADLSGAESVSGPAQPSPGASPADLAAWPSGLPEDAALPWEQLDANGYVIPPAAGGAARELSAINEDSEFVRGVDRFSEDGDVSNLDQASRFASGTTGAGELSYALYRIPLAGAQPGAVSADVNLRLRDGGGSI